MTAPDQRGDALAEQVRELATELAVPGVSVRVIVDGAEQYAYHGVTSTKNPLPVDDKTFLALPA